MTVLERFRLDNKTALVTGGNRGLGKQMARDFADAGANVAIVSRNAEAASAAAREIAAATSRKCLGYACNVADAAQVQQTVALALEWAPYAVTVNCIMPGPFGTEMNQVLMKDPKVYQDFIAKIPLGRWGNLDEIGGLAVFLASDASSFITGAAITIDGGWTAH